MLQSLLEFRPGLGYGYGFHDEVLNGRRRIGHGGAFAGISSKLDIYPDLDCTVAVMSNYDPPAAERVANRIGKLVTGAPIQEPILLPEVSLRNLIGHYARQGPGDMANVEIAINQAKLWTILREVGQAEPEKHALQAFSETHFCDARWEDICFRFTLNAEGRATEFTLTGFEPNPIRFLAVAQSGRARSSP